jgi:hypothetical protein
VFELLDAVALRRTYLRRSDLLRLIEGIRSNSPAPAALIDLRPLRNEGVRLHVYSSLG